MTPDDILAELRNNQGESDPERLSRLRAAIVAMHDLVLNAANEKYPGIERTLGFLITAETIILKRVGEA